MQYTIARVAPGLCPFKAAKQGASAQIASYVWQKDYTPRAEAWLGYTDRELLVCLTAWERTVRATAACRNDLVCLDSCLEFFFAPEPQKSLAYFNFEMNPLGTLYVGFSPSGDRAGSHPIPDAPENADFSVQTRLSLTDGERSRWQVGYRIPFDFIRRFAPDFAPRSGTVIRGNFYKCGDATEHPHWGSWNPIDTPQADFHRPEFFGELIFE